MKILPTLIRVRFKSPSWGLPTLWIPLFLIWPFVFLLSLPLLIFALIFWAKFSPVLSATYQLMCELRGTHVDVDAKDAKILISIH